MFAHIPGGVFERALSLLCGLGILGVLAIGFLIWLGVKLFGRGENEK